MSQGPPSAGQLLEAVRDWLSQSVRPIASGPLAFQARVAANLLQIVERELALGPASDAAEHARLERLLKRSDSLDALNAELLERIRSDRLADIDRAALMNHLRETVAAKLAIANPRYATTRS